MTRLSLAQAVKVLPALALAAALPALPALAGALAPGLPAHPSALDYARCSVRAFLVTPQPPARARALPKGVEAAKASAARPGVSRT
jgi:hypothetical protein